MKVVSTPRFANPAQSMRVHRRIDAILSLIIIAIVVLIARNSAHAATVSWNDGSANWSTNNWTGGVGSAPPTATDAAVIGNNGVVAYDASTGTRTVLSLQVGSNNAPKGNGTLNISGGSLTITNNVTLSDTGGNTAALSLTGGALTVGGIIADGGNGASVLTLNGGTLDLTNGSIAADTLNFQSGTLQNVTELRAGNNSTIVALTKTTAGTLTLTGTNAYTGGTNINGGILALGSAAALGTTGTISFGGGTLQYSAANTTDYSNRFSNAAGQAYSIDTNGQNVTLASNLTSSGGTFTKLGAGILTITGTDTYTGGTTISGGTLQLGNGGTTGSITGNVTDNGSLVFNRSNAFTFAGAISGSGSVTQNGTGATTLSSATGSTYAGGTTINAGSLFVNNTSNSGTGSGAVTVNNSGTLGGSGTITGSVTMNNSSVLAPGSAGSGTTGSPGTVGDLSVGAVTMTGTNVFSVDVNGVSGNVGTYDRVFVTNGVAGNVNLGTTALLQLNIANALNFGAGTQFTLINNDLADAIAGNFANAADGGIYTTANGYNFTVNYEGGTGNDLVLTAIPEPSTWVAAALTLLAIGYTQRRKVTSALAKLSLQV
jgi:autotransporter-associated beta strand protein